MQKSEFIAKIKTLAKDAYAKKLGQPETSQTKFPIINEFPSLKDVMDDLFDFQYEPFVKDVQWVAPRPTTFRVVLINGADFYLIYEGEEDGKGLYTAQIAGKKYWLQSLPEEQQASEAIARSLRYQFADTGKSEPTPEDEEGIEGEEEIEVEVEPAVPSSVEDL